MDLRFADFTLRASERLLCGPEGEMELSARAIDILRIFLDRPGELIEKSTLFDLIWPGVTVQENTLQVHISGLRKALGPGLITTVHGRGYRYAGPPPSNGGAAFSTSPPAKLRNGNLPAYRPACVARDAEVLQLVDLIRKNALVSIVGPGGVGKTTISIESTVGLVPEMPVWVVDLAPLTDFAHVASAVIQTMAIPFRPGVAAISILTEHLQNERCLLVLDNCEHLASAVSALATALLAIAPGLKLLITSQVPLGLRGERVFRLAPFALPENETQFDTAQATVFFSHCCEELGEGIPPSQQVVAAQLCHRLEGVALAIKMAAARAVALGIGKVDQQIARQLETLSVSWDEQLPRHRSLVAAINWSYGLLSPAEQATFTALSTFNGSFTFDAALDVAGGSANMILPELVRKSLVVKEGTVHTRYRLLETARLFGRRILAERGEEKAARDAHAMAISQLLEQSIGRWEKTPDREWLEIYGPDIDNMRSALEWCRVTENWQVHARLAAFSHRLWIETNLPDEGLAHARLALERVAGRGDRALEARVRLSLAEVARLNCLDAYVIAVMLPAVAMFREMGNVPVLVQALSLLGFVFYSQSTMEKQAHELFAEADRLVPGLPTSKLKAWSLVSLGLYHLAMGEEAAGTAQCETGLAMQRTAGNKRGEFKSLLYMAEVLHRNGRTEKAVMVATRAVAELRQAGHNRELGYQSNNLATYHFKLGNNELARQFLMEASQCFSHDNQSWHWVLLQNGAYLRIVDGDYQAAARLMGFLDKRFRERGEPRQSTEEMQRSEILGLIKDALKPDEFAGLLREGENLGPFEADYFAGFSSA